MLNNIFFFSFFSTYSQKVNYLGEQRNFTGTQLCAMYFTKIKDIASKGVNGAITDCVISVPGYFTDSQRRAILDSAHIAGLNPLRLLNDTTATALAFGITKSDLSEEKPLNVCFIDCGHSTYSVSIVAFQKGKLTVKAASYDKHLGGRDLDALLVDHFAAEFKVSSLGPQSLALPFVHICPYFATPEHILHTLIVEIRI